MEVLNHYKVGTLLRILREEKGLLIREAGAKLDMDPALLSKIERNERIPTRAQVQAFIRMYRQQGKAILLAWLSDKLVYEVRDEQLALQAIHAAEEKIRWNNNAAKK